MSDKLKSRKLWVAIGGLLTVVFTEWIGLGADITSTIVDAVVIIVPSYLGGQGLVDALEALGANKKKK